MIMIVSKFQPTCENKTRGFLLTLLVWLCCEEDDCLVGWVLTEESLLVLLPAGPLRLETVFIGPVPPGVDEARDQEKCPSWALCIVYIQSVSLEFDRYIVCPMLCIKWVGECWDFGIGTPFQYY
jgi:hypothetical protein